MGHDFSSFFHSHLKIHIKQTVDGPQDGKHSKPPDVRLFSFIDLPDVLTKIKGDTSCQKKKIKKIKKRFLKS